MNVNFTLISGPILSKLLVFVELIITKLCVFFLFTKTPSFINNYDKSDENRNFTIAFDQLEVELIGKRHSRNKKNLRNRKLHLRSFFRKITQRI